MITRKMKNKLSHTEYLSNVSKSLNIDFHIPQSEKEQKRPTLLKKHSIFLSKTSFSPIKQLSESPRQAKHYKNGNKMFPRSVSIKNGEFVESPFSQLSNHYITTINKHKNIYQTKEPPNNNLEVEQPEMSEQSKEGNRKQYPKTRQSKLKRKHDRLNNILDYRISVDQTKSPGQKYFNFSRVRDVNETDYNFFVKKSKR